MAAIVYEVEIWSVQKVYSGLIEVFEYTPGFIRQPAPSREKYLVVDPNDKLIARVHASEFKEINLNSWELTGGVRIIGKTIDGIAAPISDEERRGNLSF